MEKNPRPSMPEAVYVAYFTSGYDSGWERGKGRAGSYVIGEEHSIASHAVKKHFLSAAKDQTSLVAYSLGAYGDGFRQGYRDSADG